MMSSWRNTLLVFLVAMCYRINYAQYLSNMFLNGEYQNGIKAHPDKVYSVNPASNIFLEHAIISRQASPFQGPTYLPPEEALRCTAGLQCVLKGDCQSGYFTQPSLKAQNCKSSTHVCCTYSPPPPTTERPFNVCSKDYDCVPERYCSKGEIDLTEYVQRSKSNRCYAPDVCCRIPSTTLTDDGYILRTPEVKFTIPTTSRPRPNTLIPNEPTTQHRLPSPTTLNKDYLPPTSAVPPATRPSPPPYKPTPSSPPYQPSRQTPVTSYLPPSATPPQPSYKPTPGYSRPTPPPFQPSRQTPVTSYLPPSGTPPQPYHRPTPGSSKPTSPPYQPSRQTPVTSYLPPSGTPPQPDYHVTQPSNTITRTVTASPPRTRQPTKPQRGEDILSLPLDNRPRQGPKCASALECTPENMCNSIGVIVDQPVALTPAEASFRVPLTDCVLENGAPGKCCRDANYVDPWPINLAGVCATRNANTSPKGIQDYDANFGEIPWQAMILKESSKTLLGGGAIIGDQIVLTAASVVKGVSPNDVKVKAGEWELGRDSEPLPFQLVGAKSIDIHPEYNPSTGSNDMAVIRLERRLEFAQHIKPICISNEDPKPNEKCVTTGWGKQALQVHEEGAIMHITDTQPQARADCGADETGVCSATNYDSCQFDTGSALACGTGSSVLLKGVYAAENACGDGQPVRFSKPDLKWVNGFFTLQNKDKLLRKRRV